MRDAEAHHRRSMGLVKWGAGMEPEDENPVGISKLHFICVVYALSLQQREVGPPGTYAVFPDSDFQTETVSSWFKWKRWVWEVCNFSHLS